MQRWQRCSSGRDAAAAEMQQFLLRGGIQEDKPCPVSPLPPVLQRGLCLEQGCWPRAVTKRLGNK